MNLLQQNITTTKKGWLRFREYTVYRECDEIQPVDIHLSLQLVINPSAEVIIPAAHKIDFRSHWQFYQLDFCAAGPAAPGHLMHIVPYQALSQHFTPISH